MSTPKAAGDILRALMKNPAARKVVIQAGRKAASSVAAVAAKAGQSRSTGGNTTPPPAEQPPATAKAPAFKFPLPLGGVGASVEAAVNNFAKPVAEKLASSSAGRSVLAAVNNIASDALKGPYSSGSSRSTGAGTSSETTQEPTVKFVPVQPNPQATPPPVQTIKWPPPKPPTSS